MSFGISGAASENSGEDGTTIDDIKASGHYLFGSGRFKKRTAARLVQQSTLLVLKESQMPSFKKTS